MLKNHFNHIKALLPRNFLLSQSSKYFLRRAFCEGNKTPYIFQHNRVTPAVYKRNKTNERKGNNKNIQGKVHNKRTYKSYDEILNDYVIKVRNSQKYLVVPERNEEKNIERQIVSLG